MASIFKKVLARGGPFIGLVLVIGFFALAPKSRETFLTYANFKLIFTQTVIVATGALGMTMIIVSGGIDLSVGSVVALTSVVGARLIQQGWPVAGVVAAIIASGGLAGLINGAAVAGLRMPPFIITLGTLCYWRGEAMGLANNQTVRYETSPINSWMTTANPFSHELPPGVWVTVGLAVLTAVILRQTVFGRHLFALGSNEQTARLCGISTVWLKLLIYALAGCFFGLAGLFQLARLREGDPTVAVGLELDIIAAVIIGGASLSGGVGTVLGSMIGALTMAVLRNGSVQMDWTDSVQLRIMGVVIVVAVFLDRLRQGRNAA